MNGEKIKGWQKLMLEEGINIWNVINLANVHAWVTNVCRMQFRLEAFKDKELL